MLKCLSLGRLLWNDLSIDNLFHAYRKVEVNLKERDHRKHVSLNRKMILKWTIKDRMILITWTGFICHRRGEKWRAVVNTAMNIGVS